MKYKVEYSPKAVKILEKLDRHTALLIYAWVDKHLRGCENPRVYGKPLTGDKSGYWRYRVGDYRLIAEICDNVLCIVFINIGHRKNIYK